MQIHWLLLLVSWLNIQPDSKIYFTNPSFEDTPRESASPEGWQSTSALSTPDILPGPWGVQHPPQEGKTCLGLVSREDGTTEDVTQALPGMLKANTCYTFTMYLSHAKRYAGYNLPVRLRIWGAAGRNGREQLLASSPLIDHEDWRVYKFQFVPSHDMRVITFEAYYGPGVFKPYKGNILLDNCSYIERCDRA
ncbi:MAG TPA: hypothetical protein PKL15_06900 [Saprospiraceae bacterium]|nr:hypothetical protein [Saprospiraceae bacterium]HNM25139.1 hypothetical protein [Saprospiraceae bacterium]